MENKRRENSYLKKNIIKYSEREFYKTTTLLTDKYYKEGVTYKEYCLLPKYGTGTITILLIDEIEIIISSYKLEETIIIDNKTEEDRIQLSFLLKGEKIISINGNEEDILYENQESYLATITSLKGQNKIFGNRIFKEIKIKLNKSFLMSHSYNSQFIFNKTLNKDLIIPINNELLIILSDLQDSFFKDVTKKLYLKAKVLELLAIQIENYKDILKNKNITNDKSLKKIYLVRQIITQDLKQNYTLNQLSKQMAINEFDLKNNFKRVFGSTIHKFSTSKKMEHSKQLLENSQLPIYEIAELVGYKNATHYSAAFKRYFSKTPKEYRTVIMK